MRKLFVRVGMTLEMKDGEYASLMDKASGSNEYEIDTGLAQKLAENGIIEEGYIPMSIAYDSESYAEYKKEKEMEKEIVHVAVMDYGAGVIKTYKVEMPQGWLSENVEDWLLENTSYKESQCYFMASKDEIPVEEGGNE